MVLEVDLDAARQKLRERWLVVGAAALALAAVLLLGAARLTGWVLRPVLRLDSAVTELDGQAGQAGCRRTARRSSAAGQVLHCHGADGDASLDSQRQLIADTSHQLRNPMGALRLRMDLLQLELATAREHGAADSVMAELERVEEILDGVLKLAAAEHRSVRGRRPAVQRSGRPPALAMDPYPVLQGEMERALPAAGGRAAAWCWPRRRRPARWWAAIRRNLRRWWLSR